MRVRGPLGLTAVTAVSAAAIMAVAVPKSVPADASVGGSEQDTISLILPPPLLLRPIERESAIAMNLKIPFSNEPNFVAQPFRFKGDALARSRAIECLASAIYYEAAQESVDGQRAVAQVVLNRVRHPAFPSSICAVVYQGAARDTGCQFTFTCDGSLNRSPSLHGWQRARTIANAALSGAVFEPVGHSTHYHANYVVPFWATSLAKNRVVGNHIFYRWPGGWGLPAAFSRRYAGNELDPCLIQTAALNVRKQGPKTSDGPAAALVPGLTVVADPRIELVSIVDYLAARSPPSGRETEYERDVGEHFAEFSDHLAVQIYGQLAVNELFTRTAALWAVMHHSPPPALEPRGRVAPDVVKAFGGPERLEGFMSALREFATHAQFDKFYNERQQFYAQLASQARGPAIRLTADLERYTGVPAGGAHIIAAPLLKGGFAAGPPQGEWIVVGAAGGWAEAVEGPTLLEKSLAHGLAMRKLMPLLAVNGRSANEKLLRAIIDRALAASVKPAGLAAPSANDSTPPMWARLKLYEENRRRYATIQDFVPVLLARSHGDAESLHRQMLESMPKYCGAIARNRSVAA